MEVDTMGELRIGNKDLSIEWFGILTPTVFLFSKGLGSFFAASIMKAYGPGNMLLINLNVLESIGDTNEHNERMSLNKKLKGACSNFIPLILAISFNRSV